MRNTLRYTVPGTRSDETGQRDNGKTFVITELPADQAERWALRVLLAVGRAGVELPEGITAASLATEAGMATLAAVGFKALMSIPWDDAAPLLAEMLSCVQYEHASNVPAQRIMEGAACQIEEAKTFFALRLKVFELHTGFSLPGVSPTSGQ